MTDAGLKEKLLRALQDTVDNYNSGLDEVSSVAKAAADHNFNKAQTERLCEMFNTSRTVYHFENNPTEKAASFPLVGKTDVLNLLFGVTPEKKASAPVFAHTGAYNGKEDDFLFCESAQDVPLFKAAAPDPERMTDIGTNAHRMSMQTLKLRKEADDLNAEAGIEIERARQALTKLAGILSTAASTGDMAKVAAVTGVMARDPMYSEMLVELRPYLPSYVLSSHVKIARVIDNRPIAAELALVAKAASCTKKALQLRAQAKRDMQFCKDAQDRFNKLVLGYQREGLVENEMERFISDDPMQAVVKQALDPTSAFDKFFGSVTKTVAENSKGLYKDLKLRPREVDEEIGDINKRFVNLHREMLLTDLINNDSYLKEEDPNQIAQYYMRFAELSPDLANNKEVVRSVLRQAVHSGGGGYSPFDAGSFLDAEKTLKEIRGTLPKKEKSILMLQSNPEANK